MTGQRLKALGMEYSSIVHSAMIRAKETADIIHSHLPHLPISSDAMLEEGGPTPPLPTITYWGLPEEVFHASAFRRLLMFANVFRFITKTGRG
jgi:serine/threonine-protein phosphatase PGAM5